MPEELKPYYMVCNLCREKFDPSDLCDVFKHEHDDDLKTEGTYLGVRIEDSKGDSLCQKN